MTVVIVLSDCPQKLRGDMTKWFIEVNTGVYFGNMTARVRDEIWDRITENIGHGHATMVFSTSGEQHMDFRVCNSYWEPRDFDGIKLMKRPESVSYEKNGHDMHLGFSAASKQRKISGGKASKSNLNRFLAASYVVLDFETTGLDGKKNEIIEIGAILVEREKVVEEMQCLVRIRSAIPSEIVQLTGISNQELEDKGLPLEEAMDRLETFADDLPFVCHNAEFEKKFLEAACEKTGRALLKNRFIDTMEMARGLLPVERNYKLEALTDSLQTGDKVLHRALNDCKAAQGVYCKLKEIALFGIK